MPKGLVNESTLNDIANAINVLNGTDGEYYPSEMAGEILDAIPDVEVTDSIISITDAAAYPAEELEFSVEPVQDLHGYDKPWPAGGGKNLVNIPDIKVTTQTTIGRPTLSSGTYIASATIKNNSTIGGTIKIFMDGDLLASATIPQEQEPNRVVTGSFTLSEDAEINVAVSGQMAGYDYDVSQVQIELGSTATSYAPYSNICPISGWTAVNGEQCGKNLADPSVFASLLSLTYDQNTGEIYGNVIPDKKAAFDILEPNTQYTISFDAYTEETKNAYIGFKYTDNTTSLILINSLTKVHKSLVSTAGKTIKEIVKTYGDSNVVLHLSNLQIEKGTIETDYAPYTGTSIPITFPAAAGTVYGGKAKPILGKLESGMVATTVDENTPILAGRTASDGVYVVYYAANGIRRASNEYVCISDKLKASLYGSFYNYPDPFGVAYSTYSSSAPEVFAISTSTEIQTQEEYIEWLTNNGPIQVVYKLATPIEYDLTPQQVQMLLGDNNIWCDTGDTSLKYKVDLGRYIQKLIDEASGTTST